MADYLARYREQSSVTAIHPYEAELDTLSRSVSDLVNTVDGLIIHFETDKPALDDQIVAQRRHEIDSRFASKMLDRIFVLDESPLDKPRPPTCRLLGTCRDTAVLLCSFMRHQGIPARIRFGFAHMLHQKANPLHNHVVVEYWNGSEWLLAESRMPYVRGSDVPFSPDNLPRELFLTAGEAWRQVRTGEQCAQAFNGHRVGEHSSSWLMRSLLLYDIAALACYETLMWDVWGRHYRYTRPDRVFNDDALLDLLDYAVTTDCRINSQCQKLVEMFQDLTGIFTGTEIYSFSPAVGRYSITV